MFENLIRFLDINSEQALDEPLSSADEETMFSVEKGVAFCNRLEEELMNYLLDGR